MKVVARRQIESSHPIVAVLSRKISGSIDGEAIQKDITGARGIPLIKSEEMIGITPHEQSGLNAPITVAIRIDNSGFLFRAFLICFDIPERLTATAKGMVIRK